MASQAKVGKPRVQPAVQVRESSHLQKLALISPSNRSPIGSNARRPPQRGRSCLGLLFLQSSVARSICTSQRFQGMARGSSFLIVCGQDCFWRTVGCSVGTGSAHLTYILPFRLLESCFHRPGLSCHSFQRERTHKRRTFLRAAYAPGGWPTAARARLGHSKLPRGRMRNRILEVSGSRPLKFRTCDYQKSHLSPAALPRRAGEQPRPSSRRATFPDTDSQKVSRTILTYNPPLNIGEQWNRSQSTLSRAAFVSVVESADFRQLHHSSKIWRLHGTRDQRSFLQGQVCLQIVPVLTISKMMSKLIDTISTVTYAPRTSDGRPLTWSDSAA